ncbi:MAG: hypothetical protein IPQ11_16290 [Bacteroidetes bacterium]|nr:hypothetical protein [Bacteroidota bacterium]
MLEADVTFLPTRPYYLSSGGIVQDFPGDDEFVGNNPNGSAVVAYFMKKRHMIGEMCLEIYDNKGNYIKKQPATTRKGGEHRSYSSYVATTKIAELP